MNNRFRWSVLALLFALTIAGPLTAATRSPVEDLFQKALVKESVERDLDGAIHMYQAVLDQADTKSALAGEARLRLGICFEKLGKAGSAEAFYRQILAESSGASTDVIQQARTNLRRLESSGPQAVWVSKFYPSRYAVLVTPPLILSPRGTPAHGIDLALRYRLSPGVRPLAWFLEARGTPTFGNSQVGEQSQTFSGGTDSAQLSLNYQASVGLVAELPHGQQRTGIPEMGAGLALTSAKITYTAASSSGEMTEKTISPYIQGGVKFFPDKLASLLLQARYVPTPYPKSVDIASPTHSQSFEFPSSMWSLGITVQIKIGHIVREQKS